MSPPPPVWGVVIPMKACVGCCWYAQWLSCLSYSSQRVLSNSADVVLAWQLTEGKNSIIRLFMPIFFPPSLPSDRFLFPKWSIPWSWSYFSRKWWHASKRVPLRGFALLGIITLHTRGFGRKRVEISASNNWRPIYIPIMQFETLMTWEKKLLSGVKPLKLVLVKYFP